MTSGTIGLCQQGNESRTGLKISHHHRDKCCDGEDGSEHDIDGRQGRRDDVDCPNEQGADGGAAPYASTTRAGLLSPEVGAKNGCCAPCVWIVRAASAQVEASA